jgi:hypothetical protein
LAHLLPRLIPALLLGALAFGQSQPFSHRTHLKLVADCRTCHTRAAESASPADNLLPEASACRACHESVTIPAPPASAVRKFSHKQHLQFGNVAPLLAAAIDKKTYLSDPGDLRRHLNTGNACAGCHRGMDESDHVSAATANMPRMADCLVCHNRIDPPFSCETCHAPGPQLKPSSHTRDFTDVHTSPRSGLDKTTCAVCHGRRFTCQGCH